MQLRMIAIEASDHAQITGRPVFRWTVHHVKEIFLALLPRGFVLDGSSKLHITCGPTGPEPQYQQLLGTTIYLKGDFDFASYYDASPKEREEVIVQLLQSAMIDIAEKRNPQSETAKVIADTARAVQELGCSLKLYSKKLSKSSRQRGLRVDVYRNLNSALGEVWSSEVKSTKGELFHEEWMGPRPQYLDLTDYYRSSEWIDGIFIVKNRFGKIVFRLDVTRNLNEHR